MRATRRDLISVGVLAFLVSFAFSWRPSYWFDESVTVDVVQRSWSELWHLTEHNDRVHLAYYSMMHVWASVFGVSPVSMRLPSSLALAGAAAVVVALAARLSNRNAGLASGVIAAVLPGLTWTGVEARSSAFAILLTAGATLLVVRGREDEKRGLGWVLYAAVMVVAALFMVMTVLIVPAHYLLARGARRSWGVSIAAALVAILPIAIMTRAQQGQVGWLTLSPVKSLFGALVGQFALGPAYLVQQHKPLLLLVLILAVALWGLAVTARRGVALPDWWALLVWAVLPGLIMIAYGIVSQPVYSERYASWTVPALAILAGIGLQCLPSSSARLILLGLVLVSLPFVVLQRWEVAHWGEDQGKIAMLSHGEKATLVLLDSSARPLEYAYGADFGDDTDISTEKDPRSSGTLFGTNAAPERVAQRLRENSSPTLLVIGTVKSESAVPGAIRSVMDERHCTVHGSAKNSRFTATRYTCSK